MPLRDVILSDDDRHDACEKTIWALNDATRAVMRFRRYEIALHRHAIEVMRNSLTHILDTTAEGK